MIPILLIEHFILVFSTHPLALTAPPIFGSDFTDDTTSRDKPLDAEFNFDGSQQNFNLILTPHFKGDKSFLLQKLL